MFWDAPDAALAFAIAHELGHIAYDHGDVDMDSSQDYNKQVQAAKLSRQQELDADLFAIKLCKVLGYNKAELFKFISKNIEEYNWIETITNSPTSTHPSYKQRIERAKQNGFELSKGGLQQINALQSHLAEVNDHVSDDLRSS